MRRVAIFGYNPMSYEAISRIDQSRYQLLVLDHQAEHIDRAKENGFATQIADFRSDDDLREVGIGGDIDTLFCFFEQDSQNVFLTLSARALDPNLNIIAIVYSPESAQKLRAAGANKIIDPYEICARKIHDLLKRPEITDVFDHAVFGRHDLNLAEVVIPSDSFLMGQCVSQLQLNSQYNLILIGIVNQDRSQDLRFVVEDTNCRLAQGDILVILGPEGEIRAFKKDVENESNLAEA